MLTSQSFQAKSKKLKKGFGFLSSARRLFYRKHIKQTDGVVSKKTGKAENGDAAASMNLSTRGLVISSDDEDDDDVEEEEEEEDDAVEGLVKKFSNVTLRARSEKKASRRSGRLLRNRDEIFCDSSDSGSDGSNGSDHGALQAMKPPAPAQTLGSDSEYEELAPSPILQTHQYHEEKARTAIVHQVASSYDRGVVVVESVIEPCIEQKEREEQEEQEEQEAADDAEGESYTPLNEEYAYTALDENVTVPAVPAAPDTNGTNTATKRLPAGTTPATHAQGLVDNGVRWSVMAPPSVSHMCTFTVGVHAYLRQQREIVLNTSKQNNHVETGMRMEDTSLTRGAPVTVVLYFGDGRISIDREKAAAIGWKKNLSYSSAFRKFCWTGEPHECQFPCRADFADLDKDQAIFSSASTTDENAEKKSRQKSFFVRASAKVLSGREAFEIPFQIRVALSNDGGTTVGEIREEENEEMATTCVSLSKSTIRQVRYKDLRIKERIGSGQFSQAFRAEMVLEAQNNEEDDLMENNHSRGIFLGGAGTASSEVAGGWDDHKDARIIEVAVKEINTAHPKFDPKGTLNEIELCQLLGNHPNVATFLGAGGFRGDDDHSEARKPFVVTEYYENGSVRDWMSAKRKTDGAAYVTSATGRSGAMQMSIDALMGVQHLHEASVVHRDIAARNFLLDAHCKAHVNDFGLSVLSHTVALDAVHLHAGNECLPLKNMAPEAMAGRTQLSSFKSDAFMCGYLLWEIHTGGENPWSGISAREAARLVLEGKRPSYEKIKCEKVRDLVELCWKADPEDRASVGSTLKGLEGIFKKG